ncbi:MAG: transcriptional regulator [Pseudonocardia sp.]|nr:transcriptional regulator [Actinomycetes bacterium]MDN5918747.1 transcriptional regulator [Pseudonocardia sp.]
MSEDRPGRDSSDAQLDPALLDPTRLRIVATLLPAGEVEFRFVRDRVGLTDSSLSKQVKALSQIEMVIARRERTGPARRVWLRLTSSGRSRLQAHARALSSIAEDPSYDASSGEQGDD